ncbi:hypothetical protein BWI17_08105 [Betaproteobacteria bacterium GR16-43]|nr:hypothetical protein BWI17_08105 [Betaproteobacteria bacterium GR16-43]
MSSDPRILEARAQHQRGELDNAIRGYEAVLADQPADASLWHMKGMAEHQAGRLDAASASAERAIAEGGEQAPYLYLQGSIHHDLGALAAADGCYVRAAAASPKWAAPLVESGNVRMDLGRPDAALESYRAAASIDARNLRAWNGMGLALLAVDRGEEAVRTFKHALSIDPRYALAHFNIARHYNLKYDNARALEHVQAALKLDPRLTEAYLLLGDLHRRKREPGPALQAYGAAVRSAPNNAKARAAFAELLAETGRFDAARNEYRTLSQQMGSSLRAALGANLLLPAVYESAERLATLRAEYADGLARLDAGRPDFRFANPGAALSDARWTNFYLAYQGGDDIELQKRYGAFLKSVLGHAVPELYEPRKPRERGGRIRVGFLSHFFFNCTVGRYFASWITKLDRSRFEVFVYYTNEWVAEDTKRIAAAADHFRHLPGRPTLTLAREVSGDDLDILVYPELGMHPDTFTLASLRLARVQCAGWGHPDTTGHPEIDWFISCEAMERKQAQEHYSERLTLLPGLGTNYGVPSGEETATRADFGLPDDAHVYLVPQSLFKIHPDNDALIAETIARDPKALLLMFGSNHEVLTDTFAARLAPHFEARGLDLVERSRFAMPFLPHGRYLALNRLCDVMLDTLRWSGGNTTLDALAVGLPVVTLPGTQMRGRQSQAMLEALGVPELITSSRDEYVERAVSVASDRTRRQDLSARIVAAHGDLFGRDEPVRALEDFLQSVG